MPSVPIRLTVELIVEGDVIPRRLAEAVSAALEVGGATDDPEQPSPMELMAGCLIESHTVRPEPSSVRAALITVQTALRDHRHWRPSMVQALLSLIDATLYVERESVPASALDAIEIVLASMPLESPTADAPALTGDLMEARGRWLLADMLRKIIAQHRRAPEPVALPDAPFSLALETRDRWTIGRALRIIADSVEAGLTSGVALDKDGVRAIGGFGFGEAKAEIYPFPVGPRPVDAMTMIEVQGSGITNLETWLGNHVEDAVERCEIRKCIARGCTWMPRSGPMLRPSGVTGTAATPWPERVS